MSNGWHLVYIPLLWNWVVSVTLEAPKFSINFRKLFTAVAFVTTVNPPLFIFLNVLNSCFA